MKGRRILAYIAFIGIGALAACTVLGGEETSPTPEPKPTEEPQSPPTVVIDGPPSGTQSPLGEDVFVQSTATGEDGVIRIDMAVDGVVVRSDGTPDSTSQPQFSLLQLWQPAAMGEHTITVTAYTEDGTASEPVSIVVNVTEEVAQTEEESAEVGCTARSSTRLAVREGPGLNNPAKGELQMGQEVDVTGQNDDGSWLQIDYNGEEGWVYASYAYVGGGCGAVGINQAPPAAFGAAGAPAGSGGATTSGGGDGTATVEYTPTVTYTPGGPTVTPTYTYTPGGPTVTPTYTPSYTPTPTYTYTPGGPTLTPTYTYTPTYTPSYTPTTGGPTATYTPSYTPTTNRPTATYTPSYTPTTQPAAQVAPEDARFNNPLSIPLDNTASVLDFVSYPGGDVEDRVRWDITGMNTNASLSGGRARLVISTSCFGEGTENVQFFTGGQTYSCGQTIVDREVMYDSRTGSVVITAVSGADVYVQWVLTGTATRVN